jgi:hypothetical protein
MGVVARHRRKECIELVVGLGEQRTVRVRKDAGELADLPVQHFAAAIV